MSRWDHIQLDLPPNVEITRRDDDKNRLLVIDAGVAFNSRLNVAQDSLLSVRSIVDVLQMGVDRQLHELANEATTFGVELDLWLMERGR